jgi:threonine synthase
MHIENRLCSKCGYGECSNEIMWVCPKCHPAPPQEITSEDILSEIRELGKRLEQERSVAVKNDTGKPDMTLVTYAMLEDAVKVLMFGEKKYTRFNYRNPSLNFEQRMMAAVMRHVTKFNGGEEIDEESGLPHLVHALATLMMVFDRRAHLKKEDI